MANINRRNPYAEPAAEPTRQSGQAAGNRPTAESLTLQNSQYGRGRCKDRPDSLTDTNVKCTVRQGNCKAPHV
jgi:hypothetical protein